MKLIKKLSAILLASSSIAMSIIAAPQVTVTVNGVEITFENVQPQIIDNLTYVPIRGVFETMGYDVEWHNSSQSITLKNSDNIITIISDSSYIINTISGTLTNPIKIVDNSTLLPLSELSYLLGNNVSWDNSTKTVNIQTDEIKYDQTQSNQSQSNQSQSDVVTTNSDLHIYLSIVNERAQNLLKLNSKYVIEQHYSELTTEQRPDFYTEYVEINNTYINKLNNATISPEFTHIIDYSVQLLSHYNTVMKELLAEVDPTTLSFSNDELITSIKDYCTKNKIDLNSVLSQQNSLEEYSILYLY